MNNEKIKIGIPRALLFYKYKVLWKTFFTELGCEVVFSPKTNKTILNDGIALSVDENCLPLKAYLGHVKAIKDTVDFVFVPRLVCQVKNEQACTKFNATYDIIQNTFPGIKILEYSIDVEHGLTEKKEFIRMARQLGNGYLASRKAYNIASNAQKLADETDHTTQARFISKKNDDLKILIVSHPYNIYDELIGKPILDFLAAEGVSTIMADLFDKEEAILLSKNLSERLYWTANKELLGALENYKKKVDGIIFIVTFPCGPDSLVTELCIRKLKGIPMMTLVLDELQGEAGLKTRIESFVDIIKMQKKQKKRVQSGKK